MTTATRLLGTMLAALLAVTACGGSDDSSMPPLTGTTSARSDEAAVSPPNPATGDISASVATQPERGTCWAIPSDTALDPDYWFDDSAAVPCSEPHTTQTAWVLTLAEPTIARAMERAEVCGDHVRLFLGVNANNWLPWGFLMFLPSEQQIANGASWVRCDAFFPAAWDFKTVRSTSRAADGIASDPPDDLWACLDKDPSRPDQPFVPCDQPHRYEQTGTVAIIAGLSGVDEYPSPAELEAAAQEQCMPADTEQDAGNTAVTAAWDPSSVLQEHTQIAGSCFMFNRTGEPLGPRPALAH